jgi:hypothetical protein
LRPRATWWRRFGTGAETLLAETWRAWLLILVLTLLSGVGDAYGFAHAARVWHDGRLAWNELARSAAGFAMGIGLYWLVLKPMTRVGITAPEIQTMAWFGVTLIGVALISGRFLGWPRLDQAVALAVLAGIAWLVARTGG